MGRWTCETADVSAKGGARVVQRAVGLFQQDALLRVRGGRLSRRHAEQRRVKHVHAIAEAPKPVHTQTLYVV